MTPRGSQATLSASQAGVSECRARTPRGSQAGAKSSPASEAGATTPRAVSPAAARSPLALAVGTLPAPKDMPDPRYWKDFGRDPFGCAKQIQNRAPDEESSVSTALPSTESGGTGKNLRELMERVRRSNFDVLNKARHPNARAPTPRGRAARGVEIPYLREQMPTYNWKRRLVTAWTYD